MELKGTELLSSLRGIYQSLADDCSKDIFMDRAAYSVTGDFSFIREIVKKHRPEFTPLQTWKGIGELYKTLPLDKKYVIRGTGSAGRKWLSFIENDSRFIAFCGRKRKNVQTDFLGHKLIGTDELYSKEYADVAVIIASSNYEREIHEELLEHGIPESDIYLSGTVMNFASEKQYFDEDFILLKENEVFVDAGSYNLYSTVALQKRTQVKKAYAFEPSQENYLMCQSTKADLHLEQAELIPYGTWDCKTTLRFKNQADSSRIAETGETLINVTSIDEVVGDADVTFIKMDVEGAEYRSLLGARETIKRCRPKLAICVYHRPEDIFALPMYIKSLNLDYRLYLRHYSNADNETVLYAIPG